MLTYSFSGNHLISGEVVRLPPFSVPLNFIPTTLNPQHPTSPAPAGLLQKAGITSPPTHTHTPICFRLGSVGEPELRRPLNASGRLNLLVPHPRRAGRAHSHSLPALPACFSRPGRASLPQPSPVSPASPLPPAPAWPDRIRARAWNPDSLGRPVNPGQGQRLPRRRAGRMPRLSMTISLPRRNPNR